MSTSYPLSKNKRTVAFGRSMPTIFTRPAKLARALLVMAALGAVTITALPNSAQAWGGGHGYGGYRGGFRGGYGGYYRGGYGFGPGLGLGFLAGAAIASTYPYYGYRYPYANRYPYPYGGYYYPY